MSPEPDIRGSSVEESYEARFSLELPSDLCLIEATVGYLEGRCRAYRFEGSRLDLNFRVGVTEALANAVMYGNNNDPRKTVRVEVLLDPERIVIHVADQGNGFDPQSVRDPTHPDNLHATGGRGLFLIRKLMDEIEFNERGNALRMVLRRSPTPLRSVG
jgi:serine/threonine-protein kinase RsbW